ncbi:hypothetical protein SPB21_19500 [Leptothoe sp. ISB3NOV94-8A]
MKRYFVACSVLMLGAMVCWTPKAFADDSLDVPFDGVVYEQCLLSLVSSGQIEADGGGAMGYRFFADEGYGTPAQITADCNGPAVVTAAPPMQTAGPALSITGFQESFMAPVGTPLGGDTVFISPGLTQLNVGMAYDNQSPIPSGNYGFSVTVTATPN